MEENKDLNRIKVMLAEKKRTNNRHATVCQHTDADTKDDIIWSCETTESIPLYNL